MLSKTVDSGTEKCYNKQAKAEVTLLAARIFETADNVFSFARSALRVGAGVWLRVLLRQPVFLFVKQDRSPGGAETRRDEREIIYKSEGVRPLKSRFRSTKISEIARCA